MNRSIVSCFCLTVVSGLLITSASTAHSAQVTYTSLPFVGAHTRADDVAASAAVETKFLATLSSASTNTLDTVPAGDLGKSNPTLSFPTSSITAATTFGANTPSGGVQTVTNFYAVSGSNGLVAYPVDPPNVNSFTFSQPITAFGSYFIQVGDSSADTITMRFENVGLGTHTDVVLPTVGPNAGFNNVFYLGFTDTNPFDRVSMLPSNPADGIILDSITIGTVVPEPATWTLLTLGAALTLGIRIGRRAKRS
jgi:hypothetical protein